MRILFCKVSSMKYYKGAKNAVCITAGTALGVGFPEIELG